MVSENSFLTSNGASMGRYKCPGSQLNELEKNHHKSPVIAKILEKFF